MSWANHRRFVATYCLGGCNANKNLKQSVGYKKQCQERRELRNFLTVSEANSNCLQINFINQHVLFCSQA